MHTASGRSRSQMVSRQPCIILPTAAANHGTCGSGRSRQIAALRANDRFGPEQSKSHAAGVWSRGCWLGRRSAGKAGNSTWFAGEGAAAAPGRLVCGSSASLDPLGYCGAQQDGRQVRWHLLGPALVRAPCLVGAKAGDCIWDGVCCQLTHLRGN